MCVCVCAKTSLCDLFMPISIKRLSQFNWRFECSFQGNLFGTLVRVVTKKLSISVWPFSLSLVVRFVERRCSEDYFLMQRSASPGEELQTKHSFIQLLPFTPPTREDAWQALPPGKLTFSTNYWKQCRVGEETKLHNIIHILAFGEAHWAISVRGRWANFRATCANTNNCSGSPSLSALEVCIESFNAPQPISLFPVFPLVWFVLIQDPSQSSNALKSTVVKNKLRPKCSSAHKQKQKYFSFQSSVVSMWAYVRRTVFMIMQAWLHQCCAFLCMRVLPSRLCPSAGTGPAEGGRH